MSLFLGNHSSSHTRIQRREGERVSVMEAWKEGRSCRLCEYKENTDEYLCETHLNHVYSFHFVIHRQQAHTGYLYGCPEFNPETGCDMCLLIKELTVGTCQIDDIYCDYYLIPWFEQRLK